MKKNERIYFRPELEQMSDQQLNALLHQALQKEPVDGEFVRLVLQVLEDREPDNEPEIDETCNTAWKNFKIHCEEDRTCMAAEKPAKNRSWVLKAATVAAVLAMLVFVAPAVSGAGNVVEMFGNWTSSIFDFFNPDAVQPAYVFKTEHQGLQQVYDAVTELGITQPVVPMWIPEEYELVEIKNINTPTKVGVSAFFSYDEKAIVFAVDIYGNKTPHKYETGTDRTINVEIGEITHYVERNDDAWVAVWVRDNLKCSLTVDCPEDILYVILRSIYKSEVS